MWHVLQEQIDHTGGMTHRYKFIPSFPDHAKRLCGGHYWKSHLRPVPESWMRCKRCAGKV